MLESVVLQYSRTKLLGYNLLHPIFPLQLCKLSFLPSDVMVVGDEPGHRVSNHRDPHWVSPPQRLEVKEPDVGQEPGFGTLRGLRGEVAVNETELESGTIRW